ncbi:hypothetical protein CC2G_012589 [Coprinopsis cinerea AmutBmut pab1-1]|nr:hypothetical protein CC2G_012589 [Coprinopsis cinerea AmutBmut pab1-1]
MLFPRTRWIALRKDPLHYSVLSFSSLTLMKGPQWSIQRHGRPSGQSVNWNPHSEQQILLMHMHPYDPDVTL